MTHRAARLPAGTHISKVLLSNAVKLEYEKRTLWGSSRSPRTDIVVDAKDGPEWKAGALWPLDRAHQPSNVDRGNARRGKLFFTMFG